VANVRRALLIVLLSVTPVSAQKVDSQGVPYRAWDVDAAFGFLSSEQSDLGGPPADWGDNWEPAWMVSFDLGRYWSSHLKTEAGVAHLSQARYYAQEPILGANGAQVGQILSNTQVQQTQVTLAGTYQFLDNTFAHPYVSVGARVGLLDFERIRSRYLYPVSGSSLPIVPQPVEETHGLDVRVRPFVAAGTKSYFSERVFMRPEMAIAFDGQGITQLALRLGLGIDF
jgi:hypothetical protein